MALTGKAFQFPCTRDFDRWKNRLLLSIQIGTKGGFSAGQVDIVRHFGRHELVVVRRVGDIHQLNPMICITTNEKRAEMTTLEFSRSLFSQTVFHVYLLSNPKSFEIELWQAFTSALGQFGPLFDQGIFFFLTGIHCLDLRHDLE